MDIILNIYIKCYQRHQCIYNLWDSPFKRFLKYIVYSIWLTFSWHKHIKNQWKEILKSILYFISCLNVLFYFLIWNFVGAIFQRNSNVNQNKEYCITLRLVHKNGKKLRFSTQYQMFIICYKSLTIQLITDN